MKLRLARFLLLFPLCVLLLAPARSFALATASNITTWPGGNVYYTFSTTVGNAVTTTNQKAFLDAAAEWATFANLHFIARTTQANYVTVQVLSSLEGGQSFVGVEGGQQFLSVSADAWNRGTLCHEIGHLLGFIHEHQRSDRGSFVTILTNNITNGALADFTLTTNSINETAYDFLSVMHYSRNYLSIATNLDTIEPLPAYTNFINLMGQPGPIVLSAGDRAGVAVVYGAAPLTNSPVVTNTLDSGPGSTRAALYYAYDHPGTHITFNIATNDAGFSNGVFNLILSDQLPWLVNSTLLDGSSQPTNSHSNTNGPLIYLNGSLTPFLDLNANGLRFGGTNCTARGFVINGFAFSGVLFTGTNVTSNTLAGCYVATDPTGTIAVTNIQASITIAAGASNNIIGGTNAAARNLISGSSHQGVFVRDSGTTGNIIEGNYIGLNATGTAALSNTWAGIEIYNGASGNLVGGTNSGARNIISGNGLQGIYIDGVGTTNNLVEGNYLGLNPGGAAAIPNGDAGIEIGANAQVNLVGGTAVAMRNIISGNSNQGILIDGVGTAGNIVKGNYLGLNASGTASVPNQDKGIQIGTNAQNNVVGGTAAGAANVISGNTQQGVAISDPGTTGNIVQGNLIGLNPAGTSAIPNTLSGVNLFNGATGNFIGGTAAGAGNVISGNSLQGISFQDSGTSGNFVEGNLIGLNAAGTAAVPNASHGLEMFNGAGTNTIGGAASGAGNVISGNSGRGISFEGAAGNTIQGNIIGLNATGAGIVSNTGCGVGVFSSSPGNLIGGTAPGAGNVISGNGFRGIDLEDSGTSGNVIEGNIIGLNAAGTAAIPNIGCGVGLFGSPSGNHIGGTVPGAGNVISGNSGQGLDIQDSGTSGNFIQGNLIGLNAAGTAAVPNTTHGIEILLSATANTVGGLGGRNFISGNTDNGVLIDNDAFLNVVQGNTIGLNISNTVAIPNLEAGVGMFVGAQSNLIGGTTVGAANLIADNGGPGIVLYDSTSYGNILRGNSVYGNSGGGIFLYTGANNSGSESAPALTSAAVTTNTTIAGSLTSVASTTFAMDFYASPPSSPQATTWLGSKNVTTGAGGSVSFSVSVSATVPIGQAITATATDPAGNTSGLSSAVTVTGVDSVGDGIPDAWRAAHFGVPGTSTNASSCATCDPDHDGMNNRNEFLTGTDPNNPASVFKLATTTVSGTNITVNLPSVQGITYRVEARDDVFGGDWSIIADQILGTGSDIQIPDSDAGSTPVRYYRAAVEP